MVTKPETDGFTCPHRQACWQRELVRLIAAVAAASLTVAATGCNWHWNGLGVDLTTSVPTESARPTTAPR